VTPAPAALVIARAPGGAAAGSGLEGLLGAAGHAALQRLLIRRAATWAAAVAPAAAFVATEDAAALEEIAALSPRGVATFAYDPGDLAAAVRQIGRGPLLLADPACARLGSAHAAAALDDLAAGCDITFGSTLEGGWYLAGLREPLPGLLTIAAGAWQRAGGIGLVLERARELRAEVGLLRHERTLATPGDVAALLADPLVTGELRAALSLRPTSS
jgi:glycosyltransferase A (GT-A) superfamily protein (DUF2064 family)